MAVTHITAPDGSLWQLVPVELPKEMLKARNSGDWPSLMTEEAVGLWSAWLAAAPEFGGVAEPVACYRLIRDDAKTDWCSGEPSEYTREYAARDGYRIELAYTHPPAADEAMGRDSERLDSGRITFTVWDALAGEHRQETLTGVNLRAAIDAAMRQERGE